MIGSESRIFALFWVFWGICPTFYHYACLSYMIFFRLKTFYSWIEEFLSWKDVNFCLMLLCIYWYDYLFFPLFFNMMNYMIAIQMFNQPHISGINYLVMMYYSFYILLYIFKHFVEDFVFMKNISLSILTNVFSALKKIYSVVFQHIVYRYKID